MVLHEDVLQGVKKVVNSLQNIFILAPDPKNMRSYSLLKPQLNNDAGNIAGVLASLPSEEKESIERIISRYAGLLPEGDITRVWAECMGRFNSDAMLYCEEEWIKGQTNIIDARSMSDGILRFLAILVALLTRPEGSLLVIEEIDNGLHPSRSELLIKMVKELGRQRNIDVLATTHNPVLLDKLPPDMISFVEVVHRSPNCGDSRITLLEDINQLPRLLASQSLGKIMTEKKLEGRMIEGN